MDPQVRLPALSIYLSGIANSLGKRDLSCRGCRLVARMLCLSCEFCALWLDSVMPKTVNEIGLIMLHMLANLSIL
jgi:hypothetical protein